MFMKTSFAIFAAAAFALSSASSAHAYCRKPDRAPEPPRAYDKPQQPDCMRNARYGEEPDCDRYEIGRYRNEVDRYLEKLQDYAENAQKYAQDAVEYAQCEAAEARQALN